jgi:hypothetical protein
MSTARKQVLGTSELSCTSIHSTLSEDGSAVPRQNLRQMEPEFVIEVAFENTADIDFNYQDVSKLVHELTQNEFSVEIRQGSPTTLLFFLKTSTARLMQQFYKFRTRDWLYTISTDHPSKWNKNSAINLTPAHKLNLIYGILTEPPSDGGIGITPGHGEWTFVSSIFPLHNYNLNKEWITRWSTKWVIDTEEINWIRNNFGEKHALYFAFLQDYFLALIFPAILGMLSFLLKGAYSKFFGILNIAWGVVFLNTWKRREKSFAFEWGVTGSSILETLRPVFKPETVKIDPVTGRRRGYYPKWKRALKQLASTSLAIVAIFVVIILEIVAFFLEVLIESLYHGPFKSYLALLPTAIVLAVIPFAITIYNFFITPLNDWENHETEDSYEISMTQKLFSLTLLTTFFDLFLTAYIYLPFGHLVEPNIIHITEFFGSTFGKYIVIPKRFSINEHRLQQQMFYLMSTGQLMNFVTEVFVPYIQRRVFNKAKSLTSKETNPYGDDPEELEFLTEVREEAKMPVHSLQPEYQEMVVQFSLIMLFGSAWPLAPLAALINNWFELRGDAVKICVDMRRPIPSRAETIGPWLTDMRLMTWLGSMTTSSFIILFGSTYKDFSSLSQKGMPLVKTTPWSILLTVIIAEHGYFIFTFLTEFLFETFQNIKQIKDKQARIPARSLFLRKSLIWWNSPVTLLGENPVPEQGSMRAIGSPGQVLLT